MFEKLVAAKGNENQEPDYEGKFYDFLEALGDELGQRWEKELETKIDSGEITYRQACDTLEAVVAQREEVLHRRYNPVTKAHTEWMDNENKDEGQYQQLVERLILSNREENMLGTGRVAETYRIDDAPGICCKKVKNYESYHSEGENSVYQESELLESLVYFEVDGVRVPRFIQCFSGGDFDAILMEEVNGLSLEQLMNGDEEFPEKFSLKSFFVALGNFLNALHEKGIYHLDIAPRNVMVDRETGCPVLIDFGRSKKFYFSEEVKLEDSIDRAGLEATRAKVRLFLEGKLKKGKVHEKY